MMDSLINGRLGQNVQRISKLFNPIIVNNVKKMFWAFHDAEDVFIWMSSKDSSFTVQSAYMMTEEDQEQLKVWKVL